MDKISDDEIFNSCVGTSLDAEPTAKKDRSKRIKSLGAERRESSCSREMQRRSFPKEHSPVAQLVRCIRLLTGGL